MDYIVKLWECDTQGCVETNLKNNPYYPYVRCAENQYIQCEIKKKGMKTYNNNVLKADTAAQHFRSFKKVHGVQKLVACMPAAQALGE